MNIPTYDALRRLKTIASMNPDHDIKTLDDIVLLSDLAKVEAKEKGQWSSFLSRLNSVIGNYRDDITKAMENEEIEPIIEILSNAMQDLLDTLAEDLGYLKGDDTSQEESGESEDYDEENSGQTDEEADEDDSATYIED